MSRYLINTGARNWNDTANWSTTSGGAGGASVPTLSDAVIFDQNSGVGDVTLNANASCASFNSTALTSIVRVVSSVYTFSNYGDLTLNGTLSKFAFTGTAYYYQKGTGGITTNGNLFLALNRLYIDGVGITVTNADDMNVGLATSINPTNGTWNTNNNTITFGVLWFRTGIKTITLGSSVLNCTSVTYDTVTNITLNSGTSTINCSGSFEGMSLSWYNVNINISANANFTGNSNFVNLSILNSSINTLLLFGNQTVSNNITFTGSNASNYRLLIASSTIGTSRTITCNGTVTASNVDFRDITLAGTCNKDLSAITGGSGDCGGNSGIIFTTAQPQYFKKYASTANYGDAANWFTDLALTVAGRVPLPQDLGSKFLATSFNQTCTVTCNVPRIPCLDMSEVVNTVGFVLANAISVHGGFRYNSTYVTVSGNFLITCDIHGKTVQTPLYLGATFVNNFDVILSNTIAELIIDSGRKVRFTAGTTQTIAKATIGANVTLDCITASTYTLALADITTAENANIKGCIAPVSKFFAEANSVDSGSNTNVVFGDYFTPQEILIENRIN